VEGEVPGLRFAHDDADGGAGYFDDIGFGHGTTATGVTLLKGKHVVGKGRASATTASATDHPAGVRKRPALHRPADIHHGYFLIFGVHDVCRGALAFDDAAQAARSNPAIVSLRKR
jgi:hypothetical protein